MQNFQPDTHWRDSARTVRFWVFDAPACYPLVLVLMYPRLWTLIVAIIGILFFSLLNRRGFTVTVFFRTLRSLLAGKIKKARPWWIR